jgi:hypothetical protein
METRLDQFLPLAVKGAAPFSSSNQLILFNNVGALVSFSLRMSRTVKVSDHDGSPFSKFRHSVRIRATFA